MFSSRLVNRIAYGVREEPCDCKEKHDTGTRTNRIVQASLNNYVSMVKDVSYADLIHCASCGNKWYSFDEGIFNWQYPRCLSRKNIVAQLSQKRLAQGG
jgi:hypothetical protein